MIPKMKVAAEFRLPSLKKETDEAAKPEPAAKTELSAAGASTQPAEGETGPRPDGLDGGHAPEARKDDASIQWAPRWENPGPGGPLLELPYSTVEILFDPGRVFQNLRPDGGWGMPLAFLAILNAIGTVMVLWTVQQLPAAGGSLSKMMRLVHQQDLSVAMLVATLVGGTLLLPLTVVFKAGVLHVLMRLGTPSKALFATTFRAACYAMGAASALWIVPLGAVWASSFSGHPLVVEAAMLLSAGATGVWSTFILLKALACSHKVALWRAVMAVALPPFLLSVLLGVAFAYAANPR
jgi:hypothetical protein